MAQENFQEDQISECVAVIQLPSLMNSPAHNHTFSQTNQRRSNSEESAENKQNRMSNANRIREFLFQNSIQDIRNNQQLWKRRQNLERNLERQSQARKEKLIHMQQSMEAERMADCTFQPKVNKKYGSNRTLREFLQSQQQFVKKVDEKREKLQRETRDADKNLTFKPKIMRNQRRDGQPVYDRLYNLRTKEKAAYNQKLDFRPEITQKGKKIKRSGPVEVNLYNDALRRQQKLRQQKLVRDCSNEKIEKITSSNNERYVAQRFLKDYNSVLEDMGIQDKSASLDYLTYSEILYRLGFTTTAKDIENRMSLEERTLIYEGFRMLTEYEANSRNVCLFLLCVLGVFSISLEEDTPDEKEFRLPEQDGRRLQRQFNLLYRNRLYAEELKKTNDNTTYTFKPSINPQSTAMAERHRNKMLEETTILLDSGDLSANISPDGIISHADLLILNRMGRQKQMEKKKDLIINDELKNCTFKPDILDYGRYHTPNYSHIGGQHNKFQELFSLSKLPKRKQELEEESEGEEECTFHPKINKKVVSLTTPNIKVKNMQKNVLRMMEGRKQRHVRNTALQRGYVNKNQDNESVDESCSHKEPKEVTPHLIIDVNLGSRVEQLLVYQWEVHSPRKLAQRFGKEHGLDEMSKKVLEDLLKGEIERIAQQ